MQNSGSITRRLLLQTAAAAGVVSIVGSQLGEGQALADVVGAAETTSDANQYGFLVKVSKCTSCLKCVEACAEASETRGYEEPRRKVTPYTNSSGKEYYIPTSCMHCADPSCVAVCPASAISKGEGGIVVVDHDKCIGCKYCYQACPFAVPHYHPHGMDKCDYCLGNDVPLGEQTSCVKACEFDALHSGLVSEFKSMVSGELIQVGGATGPSLYLSYE